LSARHFGVIIAVKVLFLTEPIRRPSVARLVVATLVGTLLLLGFGGAPADAAPYPSRCTTHGGGTYQGTIYGVQAWIIYNDYLVQGDVCQIGKSKLAMQSDGNLALYDETGRARWAASWSKPGVIGKGSYVDFQKYDGNFVLYTGGGIPVWASDTCCRTGAELAVQADGNLVIYDSSLKVVWTTNTRH
jgi:hypothetical protein